MLVPTLKKEIESFIIVNINTISIDLICEEFNLGGKECYEPDELPTALSRDLDYKYTIVYNLCKYYFTFF